MALDLALVRFHGQTAAEQAFGRLRTRAGDAPWTHEVALVQHHHNDRIALQGTFAGHYVDVNEEDHLSQHGAAVGALTGGVIGIVFLGGPVGLAPGLVLGAAVGGERGHPDEVEPEPDALIAELREQVPKGSSAIVLLADPTHVDDLVAILGDDSKGELVRRHLTDAEAQALIATVGARPIASSGPRTAGDAAPEGAEA